MTLKHDSKSEENCNLSAWSLSVLSGTIRIAGSQG